MDRWTWEIELPTLGRTGDALCDIGDTLCITGDALVPHRASSVLKSSKKSSKMIFFHLKISQMAKNKWWRTVRHQCYIVLAVLYQERTPAVKIYKFLKITSSARLCNLPVVCRRERQSSAGSQATGRSLGRPIATLDRGRRSWELAAVVRQKSHHNHYHCQKS